MSTNVEVVKGNFENLVTQLQEKCKEPNRDFIVKVLERFGHRSGEDYFLLNNEYWDEFNSYYAVSSFFDKYYRIDNSFGIFVKMETLHMSENECEVADSLGVELPEEE